MPPIRRLPVIQAAPSSDDGRPAWHWTLIGTLFTLSMWVPLAMLANWAAGRAVDRVVGEGTPETLADRLATANGATRAGLWLAVTAAPLLSFAVACLAAGALVGRFGSRAGAKEAASGAALAAALAVLLSVVQTGLVQAGWLSLVSLFVLAVFGAGAGWLGGRLGLARRPIGERPPR